jgi:hypothetical protein
MITIEQSIPRKSADYLLAESVFYEQFNEVQFYFEDNRKDEMYFLILKKLFPNVQFEKVFGLNGKKSVIDKAEKSTNRKNRIFIVDKDFDDLINIRRTDLKNLFYLERYSIENYFFEEESIKSFIISQLPNQNRKTIRFKFTSVLTEIINKLKSLTCCFFVAHKNQIPNFQSCSLPLERFTKNLNSTEMDKLKVSDYKKKLRLGLISVACLNNYITEMGNAKIKLGFDDKVIFNHIPGKHAIKLLIKILKRKYPNIGNLEFNRVSYALADRCLFQALYPLRDSINSYLKLAA